MSIQPIRVGVIGANWSLKVHGTAWRMLPGVEVAAVCTAHRETAEAAAQLFGIPKAYWSVAEMAADPGIDIVDVGSRPSFRYEMVMTALAAGKHVYDALPFATDLPKSRAMLNAQRKAGRVGVVDAQFRWVPAALHMKRLVDDGFIGMPLGFNVQLLMPLARHDGFVYPHSVWPGGGIDPYRWLGDADSGAGGWRNFGMHTTLFLTHLLGEVEEATGTVATGVKTWKLPDGSEITPQTEDLGSATLKMRNGAIGNLQTGWSTPDSACLRVEVWGDRGRLLLVDPTFGDGISAKLYAGAAAPVNFGTECGAWLDIPASCYEVPGTNFTKETAPPYMASMGWMFHAMLGSVREGTPASPSFEEAFHAHCVVEAVRRSHTSRQWVRVADMAAEAGAGR